MQEFKENCRKLKETCFDGGVTVTKTMLWMTGAICLLAGIIHGLRMAPLPHGVIIGCGNGDGSGCEAGTGKLEQGREKKECGCRRACRNRKERGHR